MRGVFNLILVVGALLLPALTIADVHTPPSPHDDSVSGEDISSGDEARAVDESLSGDAINSGAQTEIPAGEPVSSHPEMVHFESLDVPEPADSPQDDPLDPAETNATLAIIGANGEVGNTEVPSDSHQDNVDFEALIEQLKPYKKGDKELSIGIGGSGYGGGFTLLAGSIFTYYVVNRFGPGIEIDYQATWGDVEYPQSITVFPFLKYVLRRSHRFAPYLLVGFGRTMEWGGVDNGFDSETGTLKGYAAVSSWVVGLGGGFMIGIGPRAKIQIQLLAMYRKLDEEIWRDMSVAVSTELDANGIPVATYELTGERTDHYWYPSPSFWFSFAL